MNTNRNPDWKYQPRPKKYKKRKTDEEKAVRTSLRAKPPARAEVEAFLTEFPDLVGLPASGLAERMRYPNYAATRRALAGGTLPQKHRAALAKTSIVRFPEIRAALKQGGTG